MRTQLLFRNSNNDNDDDDDDDDEMNHLFPYLFLVTRRMQNYSLMLT